MTNKWDRPYITQDCSQNMFDFSALFVTEWGKITTWWIVKLLEDTRR